MQLNVRFVEKNSAEDKNHQNVRDHCHYTEKYSNTNCNLRISVSNEIPVVFVMVQITIIILSLKN